MLTSTSFLLDELCDYCDHHFDDHRRKCRLPGCSNAPRTGFDYCCRSHGQQHLAQLATSASSSSSSAMATSSQPAPAPTIRSVLSSILTASHSLPPSPSRSPQITTSTLFATVPAQSPQLPARMPLPELIEGLRRTTINSVSSVEITLVNRS